MAWTLIDSDTAGFQADAGGGHVYTFPRVGAPTPGDLDVVFVNSNTVMDTTPSGWTLALNPVINQGTYALWRIAVGGESDNVVIDMGGNFNTIVSWSRWSGAQGLDVAVEAHADGSPASVTPSVSTGTLAGPGELVIAAALLQGSFPTVTPSWSSGYTPLTGTQYNGGPADEVSAYTAYRTDGGTAAETPQADWTSTPTAPISDRYIHVLVFTPTSATTDATATPASVDATAAVPSVTVSTGATPTPAPLAAAAAVPAPAVSVQSQATVTPAAVVAVAAVPGPDVSTGATATPGPVSAVTTFPTPAVSAGATATPAAVTAVTDLSLPSVTAQVANTVTPSTIAATADIPLPAVATQTDATAAPSTIVATSAVSAPSVVAESNATATPGPVAAVAVLWSPLVSVGVTVTRGPVAAVATVPTPHAGEVFPFGGWGVLTPGVTAKSTLTAGVAATSTLLATVSP